MDNGEAFIFGRTDWQYVLNTFCFGYHVGYKFVESKAGVCNGNFLGIGADDCQRAVLVEQSAPMGLLITNGEFVSFHGPDPTMVEVAPDPCGQRPFRELRVLGPLQSDCPSGGKGHRGLQRLHVRPVGQAAGRTRTRCRSTAAPCWSAVASSAQAKPHVSLGEAVRRAVITGNVFSGPAQDLQRQQRQRADRAERRQSVVRRAFRDNMRAPGAHLVERNSFRSERIEIRSTSGA